MDATYLSLPFGSATSDKTQIVVRSPCGRDGKRPRQQGAVSRARGSQSWRQHAGTPAAATRAAAARRRRRGVPQRGCMRGTAGHVSERGRVGSSVAWQEGGRCGVVVVEAILNTHGVPATGPRCLRTSPPRRRTGRSRPSRPGPTGPHTFRRRGARARQRWVSAGLYLEVCPGVGRGRRIQRRSTGSSRSREPRSGL